MIKNKRVVGVERIRAGVAGYVNDILGDTDDSDTENIANNSFIIPLNHPTEFTTGERLPKALSSYHIYVFEGKRNF